MNTKTKNKAVIAYHFTNEKLRDGSPIPKKGVWLKHKGEIQPCASGLYASIHPFDALQFAPGNLLHLVEVRGGIQHHDKNKLVGRERRILKTINAEKLLRDFARWNALRVLHLWPNPPEVVVRFLKTGDESLRAAAQNAAWAAAQNAAWAAAQNAAWAAAWDAAWAAARAAARAAAWAAAWDAFIAKSRRKFAAMVRAEFAKIK